MVQQSTCLIIKLITIYGYLFMFNSGLTVLILIDDHGIKLTSVGDA